LRCLRMIIVAMLCAGGAIFATASPAAAASSCRAYPDEPYHYGDWGPINTEGTVLCGGGAPDVSRMTIRLWLYAGGGKYTLKREYTTNKTGTELHIKAGTLACPLADWFVSRSFHTQIIGDYFSGSWKHINANSGEAILQC
jgi:hypothetical protein